MQNAPREHSATLSTFIKIPFVFKTFVLSSFEWPLKTGFTVPSKNSLNLLNYSYMCTKIFLSGHTCMVILEFSSFQSVDWKDSYWEAFEETPLVAAISTYLCYALLVFVGHIKDFFVNIGLLKFHACLEPKIPVLHISMGGVGQQGS